MFKTRHLVALFIFYGAIQLFAITRISSHTKRKPSYSGSLPRVRTPTPSQPTNGHRIYYVGQFGLGHRFSKLSAVYHLATTRLKDISSLELHWGSCKTRNLDIFHHLFGTNLLEVRNTSKSVGRNGTKVPPKTLLIRNDVAGYTAGQSFKNFCVALPHHLYQSNESPWLQKMRNDAIFFRALLKRFYGRYPGVLQFQKSLQWDDHTVVGVHVRAGNGEMDHFQDAGRNVSITSGFVRNICQLLRKSLLRRNGRYMLFIATDTARVIEMFQEECGSSGGLPSFDKIVYWSQSRVEEGKGVSYQAWKQGEECFDGWLSSMIDMALLASSHVLIAGMRSTFTQILPRSVVMGNHGSFCEVGGVSAQRMTCFDSERDWLFRYPSQGRTISSDEGLVKVPVIHKVLVHLPEWDDSSMDSWEKRALLFLRSSHQETFEYGHRFDPKFRGQNITFQTEWTWQQ